MTRTYLKFDRKTALQYQLQMVNELLAKSTLTLQQLQGQNTDMKNMRNMLTGCPDTWKPLLQLLKPVSKETDDAKKVLFQQKVVQYLKTKFTAISLMLEDHRSPTVRKKLVSLVKILTVKIFPSFRPGQNNISKKWKQLTKF